MCWGSNFCGGYGCGLFPDDVVDAPEPLSIGVSGPAIVVAIDGLSACALLESGEVECWGRNAVSQLGRGIDDQALEQDPVPARIVERGPFVSITMSSETVCAWRANGEVYCWRRGGWVMQRAQFPGWRNGQPRMITQGVFDGDAVVYELVSMQTVVFDASLNTFQSIPFPVFDTDEHRVGVLSLMVEQRDNFSAGSRVRVWMQNAYASESDPQLTFAKGETAALI